MTWVVLGVHGQVWELDTTTPSNSTRHPNIRALPLALGSDGYQTIALDGIGRAWHIGVNPYAISPTTNIKIFQPSNTRGVKNPNGLASDGSTWYAIGNRFNSNVRVLGRVDPSDLSNTNAPFGIVGSLPAGLTDPSAIAHVTGTGWFVAESGAGNDSLWRIDPANPSSTTAPYGRVGDFPANHTIGGLGYGNSELLSVLKNTADNTKALWRIDPTNPSNTSGNFGSIGAMPAAFDPSSNAIVYVPQIRNLYYGNTRVRRVYHGAVERTRIYGGGRLVFGN